MAAKNILSEFNESIKSFLGMGEQPRQERTERQPPRASANFGHSRILYTHTYDGQKNHGELGPIKSYLPDYSGVRYRSWQAMLESEIAQIVIGKYIKWVIGKGLKLQSEPQKVVLKSEGIDLDVNKFTDLVESRWTIFSGSNKSDHAGMRNLNLIADETYKNAIVGGDVLVVQRYDAKLKTPTIQIIDAAHVQSPLYGSETYAQVLQNGNRIENGIELSPRNEHIAYWVRISTTETPLKYERIAAKDSSGKLTMAFLVYGLRHRLDNHRGIPLLSVVLETMKKLERYKEATLGSAEERQKITMFIKHGVASNGENPLIQAVAKAVNDDNDNGSDDLPRTIEGDQLADKVFASTNKQIFNMPVDSEIDTVESKNELYFKDFYNVNIDLICAALQIPPNVALSKYDSNFSASRAALKDWEHSLNVARYNFAEQFYKPIYRFWLHIQYLQNKIQAPGYITAFQQNDWMVIDAYLSARFVGANVPHIDPVKEVTAERLKLGDTGASLPLTTLEAATEALSGGDSDVNMEQYAAELEESKGLGIEIIEPAAVPIAGKNGAE